MSTLHCLELVYDKYLFSVYSKWKQIKQIAPDLNRGLSSNFCWLRMSEPSEIYRLSDVYGEACFNLQIDKMWVYHYKSLSKRQSMEWKHMDSLVKKKFWAQQSLKKVILTVF